MRKSALVVILVALLAPTAGAQEPCPDPINFGRWWNSAPEEIRLTYLAGFQDGQASTYSAVRSSLVPNSDERLRKKTYLFYDLPVLRDVITDLYKDPANTYISIGVMIYIARDKLNGEDLTKRLQTARIDGRAWDRFPCSTRPR